MKRVILDQETLAKLHEMREELELYDENGRRLGMLRPDPSRDRALYEGVDSPISDEELRRRAQELGGRTLKEIMADLEKRA